MPIVSTSNRATALQTAILAGSAHRLNDHLDMIGAPMSFGRNEEICGESEPADYVYKVVSGAVRTFKILDDGRRQISAFHLPGDFFGMEHGDDYSSSSEAIGNTTVVVFKRSAMLALANRDSAVARQMWAITIAELHRAQEHVLLLIKSAEERVGSFLLEMAGRSRVANEIDLPMSRQDIADYLGLTIETISRTLTKFETAGVIGLPTNRCVVLRNHSAIGRLGA